jgi:hypothetical protein
MNIYNSVLLNSDGIIREVKTTFLSSPKFARTTSVQIDKYIILYTYSLCVSGMFTEAFSRYPFMPDNIAPLDDTHAAMQEAILSCSGFVNLKTKTRDQCYAELVVFFTAKEKYDDLYIQRILRKFLNHYNSTCRQKKWKVFAFRKFTNNNALIVSISLANG